MSTQVQAQVGAALEALGLKPVPDESERVGGPSAFEVTPDTLRVLTEGTKAIVDSQGEVKVQTKVG